MSFIKVAIFLCNFRIKLTWLQRRNNEIKTILYDRDYLKTANPAHLEKLQIIQNISNLMFQINFIFSG